MSKLLHRRFLAIIVVLSILCLFIVPSKSAFAIESVSSTRALATVEVKDLANSVKNTLPESIHISPNDKVSLVSKVTPQSVKPVTELTLTHIDTNEVHITKIAAYDYDENQNLVQVNVPYTVNSEIWEKDGITNQVSNYGIMIYTTAHYELDYVSSFDLFVRPFQVEVMYENSGSSSCNFESLNYLFVARGDLYIDGEYDISGYSFYISGTWRNLIEGRTYSCRATMPSGYWIRVNNIYADGCFSSQFDVEIDGQSDTFFGNFQ